MTIDELKAEADKHGYRLVKKEPYISVKACPICGEKPVLLMRGGLVAYACAECDTAAFFEKSERNARRTWNTYAERRTK